MELPQNKGPTGLPGTVTLVFEDKLTEGRVRSDADT